MVNLRQSRRLEWRAEHREKGSRLFPAQVRRTSEHNPEKRRERLKMTRAERFIETLYCSVMSAAEAEAFKVVFRRKCQTGVNAGKPGPCPGPGGPEPAGGNRAGATNAPENRPSAGQKPAAEAQEHGDAESQGEAPKGKPTFASRVAGMLSRAKNRSKDIPTDEQLGKVKLQFDKTFGLAVATIGGKKFVVKVQASHDGKTEALMSNLAPIAGVRMPSVAVREIKGMKVVTSQMVDGMTPFSIRASKDESPHDAPEGDKALIKAMAKVPKEEVDRHALFDYVTGYNDAHSGNYIITPDHHLVGIDKELSLNGPGGKGNSATFDPPFHLGYCPGSDGNSSYESREKVPLSRSEVARAVMTAEAIATHLGKLGRHGAAKGVRIRGKVLRGLLKRTKGDPTVADLVAAGNRAERQARNGPR
jgi:hypothetical protein